MKKEECRSWNLIALWYESGLEGSKKIKEKGLEDLSGRPKICLLRTPLPIEEKVIISGKEKETEESVLSSKVGP